MMLPPAPEQERSIPKINALVRSLVEQETLEYPFWTSGVVTRQYVSHLGHVYFDLTDQDYTISCFLHERIRNTLSFSITNTSELQVYGSIRVYEKSAKVQIDVEQVQLIASQPYVMDATVKQQLADKGLWPKDKKPLPDPIQKIAIVTSKNSDALHDFRDTYHNERGTAQYRDFDVRIQGQQAPNDIAEAIKRINREQLADVIVLIRGGGRDSDLAVFNDVLIAEAICQSTIPIVTGIGHQKDHTLADQLADVSCITPTATGSHLAKHGQAKVSEQPTQQADQKKMVWLLASMVVLLAIVAIAAVAVLVAGR